MPQHAPDYGTRTHRQSGFLTRLNTTPNLSIAIIEGTIMTDNLSLVFVLSRVVSAVYTAVIGITRVVTVDGDAGALE